MQRASLIMGLAIILGARTAQAFVCTQAVNSSGNPNGPALAWMSRNISYSLNASGTRQLPIADTFAVLQASFLVWQNLILSATEANTCGSLPGTDLTFTQNPMPSHAAWVGYDFLNPDINENLLVFRDDVWPNPSNAGDIIALTTTTYSALTGAILDADIEFNSARFQFSVGTSTPTTMDLQNTAVHEIGHFIGLAHCGAVTCGHQEVMEPFSAPGETVKRELKCDDRAGIVFKYPAGKPNGYCVNIADPACGACAPPQMPVQTPLIRTTHFTSGRNSGCAGARLGSFWPGLLFGLWACQRSTQRASRMRWIGMFLGVLVLTACGGKECTGVTPPTDPNAPMIVGMVLDDQVKSDPWRIILAADFVDNDGDLGGGSVAFYPNHNTTAVSNPPLNTIFSASGGVPLTATSGRLALPLRFSESTVDGANLHLGAQFTDAANHVSNCFTLDLEFNLIRP